MPHIAVVILGYVLMFVAQSFGPEVIEMLHGYEARVNATAPKYNDVRPDAPLEMLCEGYESHHFDQYSNCSHAAGMILSFITVFSVIMWRRMDILVSLPPIWYLYAWAGHFFIQKDIPAVFVYGMTLRGWFSGEYCSICALLGGRTITAAWEYSLTLVIVLIHLVILPPLAGWGFNTGTQSTRSKSS